MIWMAIAILLIEAGVQGVRALKKWNDELQDEMCRCDPEYRRWLLHWQRNLDRIERGEAWTPDRQRYPKDGG